MLIHAPALDRPALVFRRHCRLALTYNPPHAILPFALLALAALGSCAATPDGEPARTPLEKVSRLLPLDFSPPATRARMDCKRPTAAVAADGLCKSRRHLGGWYPHEVEVTSIYPNASRTRRVFGTSLVLNEIGSSFSLPEVGCPR
jgi:hypothetical protein